MITRRGTSGSNATVENLADKEAMGEILHWPKTASFHDKYFPFKKGYLSPLIAVQKSIKTTAIIIK